MDRFLRLSSAGRICKYGTHIGLRRSPGALERLGLDVALLLPVIGTFGSIVVIGRCPTVSDSLAIPSQSAASTGPPVFSTVKNL
jgi:hypothetical protein